MSESGKRVRIEFDAPTAKLLMEEAKRRGMRSNDLLNQAIGALKERVEGEAREKAEDRERMRYEILQLALNAVDGVQALLRKVDPDAELEGQDANLVAETLRAVLAPAQEELCGWGCDLQQRARAENAAAAKKGEP